MNLPYKFIATAIGSFPYTGPYEALDLIFDTIPDAPVWPQLPGRSITEHMAPQYSEGIPGTVIDTETGRVYINTSIDHTDDFIRFYETFMKAGAGPHENASLSDFAITEEYASGLYAFERKLKAIGGDRPFVKIHTTGPCTFCLSLTDENKKSIYYNDEYRDIAVKTLAMKSAWQIRKFRPFGREVICFIDEPVLAGFGSSAYISVKREDVVSLLGEVVEAIHREQALAGIHVCANTEWSIIIDSGVDILNFDAYGYGSTIALYPAEVKKFLESGGVLAWGIVPTSEKIRVETPDSLRELLSGHIKGLSDKTGLSEDFIEERSMITPSCGTGSMKTDDAVLVFTVLKKLSEMLRST